MFYIYKDTEQELLTSSPVIYTLFSSQMEPLATPINSKTVESKPASMTPNTRKRKS